MKSFNKMLYETIKNLNISKKDYIQLLTLLRDLINIGKEKEKLEIEIQKLKRELWFISSQNQREYAKSLNFTLDEKYNGKKIDLIKRELFTREQIFHIISQNEKIQDLKSSIIKPTKNIKSLNHDFENPDPDIRLQGSIASPRAFISLRPLTKFWTSGAS